MANAWVLKPLPIASVASSSVSKGDASYVANDFSGVVWASSSATSTALLIDFGGDVAIDTLALFGVVAPANAQMTVQVATSDQGNGFGAGSYYDSPSQAVFAGTNRLSSGTGVALWSAPSDGRPAARYLRIVFALSPAGVIQISRAAAGVRMVLGRNFVFGAAMGVRDLGALDFSRRGVLLRSRGKKLRTMSVTFSNTYKDEVEAAVQPLVEQVGNTEPVVLITDPTADAMRERRCFFGPFVGDLQNTWRTAVAWEWKANVVSLF